MNDLTIDVLKAHLSLCVQMFENVCEQAGIDTTEACLTVSVGEREASIPIGQMLQKWKEMAK